MVGELLIKFAISISNQITVLMIEEFKSQIIYRLDESHRMIQLAMDKLSNEQCWQKPNPAMNTVGNLMLHLCGNIRQYAISSLGQQADTRQRDEEFAHKDPLPKQELLRRLSVVLSQAKTIILDLPSSEWRRVRSVQGFSFSGIGIVIHITEHLSYHTGQIAWLAKYYAQQDLGFYTGMDLNAPNE